jgi:hypothetical protein
MGLIATKRTITKLVALLFVAAAITTAVIWSGSSTPANAQQEPPCGHDWCDWYQVCRWEYWAWDAGTGWELVHTDGYCSTE